MAGRADTWVVDATKRTAAPCGKGEGGDETGGSVLSSILIVDDDPGIRDVLGRSFERWGWLVTTAATGGGGLDAYEAEAPDVVLLDLVLPDLDGIAVLRRLRERNPDVAVIMLTGHGDIETAVEAMQVGAENFLTKPFDLDHLSAVVDRTLEKVELRRRNRYLAGEREAGPALDALGASEGMKRLTAKLRRLAEGDTSVLLLGETGTGKGWVAQQLHRFSPRSGAPFVEVNCGGLTVTFLDSELFGHEKGAFTDAKERKRGLFEIAERGTVLLDEVGDLAPELQPKLLKFLETHQFRRVGGTRTLEVDVRLIAATNHDLERQAEDGRFRKDLYYRLAVMPVRLPPLRERAPEDIAALTYTLLKGLRDRVGSAPERISDEALDHLVRHPWPGNIRELRNVLERIVIMDPGTTEILPRHLPAELRRGDGGGNGPIETLEDVERRHIIRALERFGGNRSRTARSLGIARATLYEKIDRFGLKRIGR